MPLVLIEVIEDALEGLVGIDSCIAVGFSSSCTSKRPAIR